MASSKDAWVNEYWSNPGEGEGWNPLFTRPFNDWEVEDAERLLMDIGRYVLHVELEDKVSWNLSRDGVFLIKSMYCVLQQYQNYPFPWSIVWKACGQPRICFFTWGVAWGRILTLDHVQKKRVWIWPIAVFYFWSVRKQWNIFSFNVLERGCYGIYFSLYCEVLL